MAQDTISVRTSNRKAREERLRQFDSLADFANLGDAPAEWATFRRKHPQFFPGELNRYIYDEAEIWYLQANLNHTTRDEFFAFCAKHSVVKAVNEISDWGELSAKLKAATEHWRPMLLIYRDLLRSVILRKDPQGSCLAFLYGLQKHLSEDLGVDPLDIQTVSGVVRLPEEFRPFGKPVVDGATGAIVWEFASQFQRAIYDLMEERWRAMVCPWCGKYFIADKTAQKFCSSQCWGDKKSEQMREYYHRKGKAIRGQRKTTRAKSPSQRRKRK